MKMVMKVFRKEEKNVTTFQVGDQIELGKYTATCQLVNEYGNGVFMLDQYLDKPYAHSDNLLTELNRDLEEDKNFERISDQLVRINIDNVSKFFRLPTIGEMFGKDGLEEYYEPDHENGSWDDQFPLMKDRRNRTALRDGDAYEWGWLKNRYKKFYATSFASVNAAGYALYYHAAYSFGIRPIFEIRHL